MKSVRQWGLLALLISGTPATQAQSFGVRDVVFPPAPRYDEAPRLTTGAYPVTEPTYQGQVKHVLVLSGQWIIVAIYDVPEVVAKVDELAGGDLLKAVEDWVTSADAGRPNWSAWRRPQQLYNRYLATAREALNERALDQPFTFRIGSPNDPAYLQPQPPVRVTRSFLSLGGPRVRGGHLVDYAHYCLIELPTPMQDGHEYRIGVRERGGVSFTFEDRRTVSRAIKVNQAGYLPDATHKYAYLGAYGFEFGPIDFSNYDTFEVIAQQSGEVVLTGNIDLAERNPRFAPRPDDPPDAERPPIYGEDVYVLDLGPLTDHGEFFISIPGVGRSWTFVHGPDAYGEVFFTAMRGFYHQRAALELTEDYTAWTRPLSTMHDVMYETGFVNLPPHLVDMPDNYNRFDIVAATLDKSRKTEGVVGGWYDAADWVRTQHHYTCLFDMLYAYEFRPALFQDGQLHIPESGNGVPDILDEAAFGLEVWRRSQMADGGVSGMTEASTHPDFNAEDFPFGFSPRNRWNSLMYAAAGAQLARLLEPYDAERAAVYAQSARAAWAFGINPTNSLGHVVMDALKRRGDGDPYTVEWEERDEYILPYKVHAALELARLDNDPSLLASIGEWADAAHPPLQWRFSTRDFSIWLFAGLALGAHPAIPEDVIAHWRDFYLERADELLTQIEEMPYRKTWPRHQDFRAAWGAFTVTNFNRLLALAWQLTGEARYRNAIINNADFMLGANPMGMSWTTGIGYVYPIDIQHAHSDPRREPLQWEGFMDPVPGITIYGLTGQPTMHRKARSLVWESPNGDEPPVSFIKEANRQVPFARRWSAHPTHNTGQCEFTVWETMAATAFTAALLLPEDWIPNESLKQRAPRREDLLFGRWHLP